MFFDLLIILSVLSLILSIRTVFVFFNLRETIKQTNKKVLPIATEVLFKNLLCILIASVILFETLTGQQYWIARFIVLMSIFIGQCYSYWLVEIESKNW